MSCSTSIQRIQSLDLLLASLFFLVANLTLFAQEQPVGWDPGTVWDGPNPAEPVALFLLGMLVVAPISFFLIRLQSRRAERQVQASRVGLFKN